MRIVKRLLCLLSYIFLNHFGLLGQSSKLNFAVKNNGDTIFSNQLIEVKHLNLIALGPYMMDFGKVQIDGKKYPLRKIQCISNNGSLERKVMGDFITAKIEGNIIVFEDIESNITRTTYNSKGRSHSTNTYRAKVTITKQGTTKLLKYTYNNLYKLIKDDKELADKLLELKKKQKNPIKINFTPGGLMTGGNYEIAVDYSIILEYNSKHN